MAANSCTYKNGIIWIAAIFAIIGLINISLPYLTLNTFAFDIGYMINSTKCNFTKNNITKHNAEYINYIDRYNIRKHEFRQVKAAGLVRINGVYLNLKGNHLVYGMYGPLSCHSNAPIINISMARFDGLGAQLKAIFIYIAFERVHNKIHEFNKSAPIYHYYYFPLDYSDHGSLFEMEQFINIGNGLQRNFWDKNDRCICCHFDFIPNEEKKQFGYLFDNETLQFLRDQYNGNKQELDVSEIYDKESVNVAVHIRRGDACAINLHRCLPDNYYVQLMQFVFYREINGTLEISEDDGRMILFHIYSEWGFNKTTFESLISENVYKHKLFKIKYHISISLNMTFHGLVISDVLIMSSSDLSSSAALLNRNTVYYKGQIGMALKNWSIVVWKGDSRHEWKVQQCNANTTYQLDFGMKIHEKWKCKTHWRRNMTSYEPIKFTPL